MSALDRLKKLMGDLKTIEHDRWDTAANAVLELRQMFAAHSPVAAPDPKLAERVDQLAEQVSVLKEQVTTIGEAVAELLKQQAPAPVPAPPAEAELPTG